MTDWLESVLLAMTLSDYLFLYGAMVAAAGALLVFAFIATRRYRFMNATATSMIRSAAQGQVELKGLAEWLPGDSVLSPFSARRCVWYHCTIEKRERRNRRTTWTNILDECSGELFRLVDDTGECVIDPDHAHVIAEIDRSWYGNDSSARQRPPVAARLLSIGLGNYRFRERLITPATPLYALGWFRTLQPRVPAESIEEQTEELVRQWKLQPARYLREFDLDGDSRIQRDEWKAVRAAARNQVLAKINRENRPQHLMSKPEDGRLPYILSAEKEESVVAKNQLLVYLSLAAAFILFSALVVMTSIRSPLPW